MDKSSILEQKILPVLNLIEYCCEKAELYDEGNKKELKIMYSDLIETYFSREDSNFYLTKKYLEKNGINLSIILDITEEDPNNFIDSEHPGENHVEICVIKGLSIKKIKEIILNLKNKFQTSGKKQETFYKENIINFNTATLTELFEGLKTTKIQLAKKLNDIEKNYKKEIKKIDDGIKSLSSKMNLDNQNETLDSIRTRIDDLDYLKEYYESRSFKEVLSNSVDVLTIIDKILSQPKINKNSVNQLKRMSENNRRSFLGKFEDAFSGIIEDKNPSSIYNKSIEIDSFLKNLVKITINLEDSIGEYNPLITHIVKEDFFPFEKEESSIVKGKKKLYLPIFPRTEWSKVSIKFIDDRNTLFSNSKETKPFTPETIGCIDGRTNKQDKNWKFLVRIAKGKGVTNSINKNEREKQKKQKQKITDILRKIFKNDTDPFETEKGGVYKTKFNIEYIEENIPRIETKKELLDLNEVYNEMTDK